MIRLTAMLALLVGIQLVGKTQVVSEKSDAEKKTSVAPKQRPLPPIAKHMEKRDTTVNASNNKGKLRINDDDHALKPTRK